MVIYLTKKLCGSSKNRKLNSKKNAFEKTKELKNMKKTSKAEYRCFGAMHLLKKVKNMHRFFGAQTIDDSIKRGIWTGIT